MGQQGWTHWIQKRKWEMRLAVVVTLAVGILLGTLISDGVRAARDNPTPAGTSVYPPTTDIAILNVRCWGVNRRSDGMTGTSVCSQQQTFAGAV